MGRGLWPTLSSCRVRTRHLSCIQIGSDGWYRNSSWKGDWFVTYTALFALDSMDLCKRLIPVELFAMCGFTHCNSNSFIWWTIWSIWAAQCVFVLIYDPDWVIVVPLDPLDLALVKTTIQASWREHLELPIARSRWPCSTQDYKRICYISGNIKTVSTLEIYKNGNITYTRVDNSCAQQKTISADEPYLVW